MKNRFLGDPSWVDIEKRQHLADVTWGDLVEGEEVGCRRLVFASHSHEPSEVRTGWVSYLSEALGQLHLLVEQRQREYRRVEALTERVRALESKVAGIETCESHFALITTFEPDPYELMRDIKVVI